MADTALLCRIKNRAPENGNLAVTHMHMYTHTLTRREKLIKIYGVAKGELEKMRLL